MAHGDQVPASPPVSVSAPDVQQCHGHDAHHGLRGYQIIQTDPPDNLSPQILRPKGNQVGTCVPFRSSQCRG